MTLWQDEWEKHFQEAQERQPEFDPSVYYRSGRVSKEWPAKEGPDWWAINGPKFVQSWTKWREASGLRIATLQDGEDTIPGIEVPVSSVVFLGEDRCVEVVSIIDRIMVDGDGNYYLVDLKSGSMTEPWPLQLALNNMGLRQTYGLDAQLAGYWKARNGGLDGPKETGGWHDLSRFTDEVLCEWVASAQAIKEGRLFIPSPNNLCASACGVRQWCIAMGGVPYISSQDATLSQGDVSE